MSGTLVLGYQRETLGDQKETLGDKKNDLDDQRKDLNESKAAMPQIVKQTGWAKPNQLPAGPRKKRRLCRRLFSSDINIW